MMDWTSEIDQTTEKFFNLFGSLTEEQLNFKLNPETWSIAQNIDHIIVLNQSYFPVLSDMKAGKNPLPFMAKIGFMVSFFGKIILSSSKPDRKRKMKTFAVWEPAAGRVGGDILDRFKKHQTELKQHIEASGDLIKQGAVIASPANKNIVYKLETAFDIIITHEKRHLEQAKEVLAQLKKKQ